MQLIAVFVQHPRVPAGFLTKTLRIMKIAAFLLCAICLQVSANGFAQKVNLNLKDVTLEQVFINVKEQTGLSFIWDEGMLKNSPRININVTNASVNEVLELCFMDRQLTYKLIGKMVVIKERLPERVVIRGGSTLLPPTLVSPEVIITGSVEDENGDPIAGATVLIKGTRIGSITDGKGQFKLDVKSPGMSLVITCQGYIAQEIKVKDGSRLTIVMKKSEKVLDEVMISTGIFTRKKESYTGSVTVVTAKELQQFGNRNLLTSLRNIDPSFNIVESNSFGSNPNRLPEIQIRGNSSLPNVNQLQDETRVGLNTPLVILDGFESTLQRLLDINENEVETLTLLKDASATSIYGSRGANGVIVIKTKAPLPGKLRVTYRGDVTAEIPDLTGYSLLKSRDKLELERRVGLYNNARAESDLPLKRYYNYLLNEVNSGVETDWMAKPLRTGVGNRHNLRLEGGDNVFRYSASAQINDIQGVMKGSFRRTFNGTINLTYIYKKAKFTNSLMIGLGNTQESPYGTFSEYVKQNPYWRAYDEKGNVLKFLGNPGTNDYSGRWGTLPTNPLYNATLNTFDKTNSTTITNNTSVEWRMNQEIILRARLGVTKSANEADVFKPANHTDFANFVDADFFRKGSYRYGTGKGLNYDGSLNLSYAKDFAGKHSVYAGADANIRQNKSSNYGFVAEGFSNPNFDFVSMALQYAKDGKPTGSESLTRSMGLTANLNYTYDDRYSLDFSARRDGSSQFGAKKRFAPFWSAGAGWNLHKEKMFENSPVVDRLKLRGSLGITGSQEFNSYQALSTYRYYTDDRYYGWLGSYLLGLGNEDLQWQQKMNYDIGIDANFFDNRVSLVADYYIETTKGLVSSVDLPASNGFSNYIENIGSIENKGFEVKATVFILRNPKSNFAWSVSGAMMHNKNKIIDISEALKTAQKSIENATGATPNIIFKEGYSTNTIWVVPSIGIDPSTGKELYLSKSGVPTYTWNAADLQASGISEPRFQGNFSTMVRYKGLSVNISMGYRFGGQLYNQTLISKVENAAYSYNVDSRVYDSRWQAPGDNAAFKGLLVTAATNKTSRFVQNERTLNCQNVNLQYDLKSKAITKKLGMQGLSFAANMADAFYLSSVRRERGTTYPFSRMFSLTVNAMF